MESHQPSTPAAQTMSTANRLNKMAWRRVVGLEFLIAGGSLTFGASSKGTTGERWWDDTEKVLERRSRSALRV